MTIADIDTAAVDIDELRTRFRGALLRPGEEGYDEARRIWNGAIDRRPALIARCAGADDVVAAVRFARERELAVSVRGGGHAVAGLTLGGGLGHLMRKHSLTVDNLRAVELVTADGDRMRVDDDTEP